jgi:exopolysaccharide biosynthesis polyprenyl glycosylphosphotransferase
MNTFKRQFLLEIFRIFDIFVCLFAFALAITLTKMPLSIAGFDELISVRISAANLFVFLFLLGGWHATFIFLGFYDSRRLSKIRREMYDLTKGAVICSLITFILNIVYPVSLFNSLFFTYFTLILFAIMLSNRLLLRFFLKELRLAGINLRHVVIIGTNQNAHQFAERIKNEPELGYLFKGFVDNEWHVQPSNQTNFKLLSNLGNFSKYLRDNIVDEVIICLPVHSYYAQIETIITASAEQGILVRMKNDIFKLNNSYPKVEYLGNEMLLTYCTGQMRRRLLVFKKLYDFAFALILFIITLPLFLLTALAIKLTSPGPVFFSQERLGFNKRRFKLYKFRTMVPDAEKKIKELEHLNEIKGAAFKLKDDPRITPIGKILRKLSLDELPQIINVLKGDMSLVGPRPLPERDFKGFNTDWHRRRFCVKPGITCLWQVSGRNNISFDEWMALDMKYIDNWSPLLDMKILFKTVPAVLSGHGAS